MIENYDKAIADETQTWDCHHRLEIQGQFRNSAKLMKQCGMYYHIPASQLIFLTHSEHISLHNVGRTTSADTKIKMSLSSIGKNKGKVRSDAFKKSLSEKFKNRKWFTNGIVNHFCKECPIGFTEGYSRHKS